ncbi:hypothetical protein B9Z19DRAFT_620307 [Tuber borchii]|uniref:Uncharacterized protein n=1 Tax=Tuber borchii TaxID=42251 RepID=A0A2T6ZBD8_TUBBO|nr:hypothetical protein B9Z19DRAFT_620307 [Tuber borchii]
MGRRGIILLWYGIGLVNLQHYFTTRCSSLRSWNSRRRASFMMVCAKNYSSTCRRWAGVHNSKCSSMTEQRSKGVQASEGEGKGKGREGEGGQNRQGKGMAGRQDRARREKGLKGGGRVEWRETPHPI